MTPVETVTQAVNVAAQQNDRWLFLAALVIMGLSFYTAMRWLVGRFERGQETITRIAEDSIKTNKDLAVVIDRNNQALKENTEVIQGLVK